MRVHIAAQSVVAPPQGRAEIEAAEPRSGFSGWTTPHRGRRAAVEPAVGASGDFGASPHLNHPRPGHRKQAGAARRHCAPGKL